MTDPYLDIDHVTVRHPGATLVSLDDVSITVQRGEVLAVLGSSGCGKTTLLRAIAGLTLVTDGRIVLDGRDLGGVPAYRRGIGFMFQDHALFPHLGVGDNVAFGLRIGKMPRARRAERVAEVLEMVGLAGFGSRSISSLSGGERQRVALARTLAPSPLLLLLDEPMGSLDRALRDRLVPELGELIAALGLTALYVTHDHAEAFELADHLVVMDAGRVVQEGTPADVDAAPVSDHVARLLGHRGGRQPRHT
jgi:thiamine transport system ATP-binding protein